MKKINWSHWNFNKLSSLVKPKIFWGSLVILLSLCLTFYSLEQAEKKLRIFTEQQLTKTFEEKNVVQTKLIETIKIKNVLEGELQSEQEKTLALRQEVSEKEQQITLALDQLEQEKEARYQAESQLLIAMEEKTVLEAKMRASTQIPGALELEEIVIQSGTSLGGKVLAVYPDPGFIVVNLGEVNNLSLGDILSVYRNDTFLGRVRVEQIKQGVSAAMILPDWRDVEFKENDEVRGI